MLQLMDDRAKARHQQKMEDCHEADNASDSEGDTDLQEVNGTFSSTKVTKQVTAWLLANYELAEGYSLPRESLYDQYVKLCRTTGTDAVNAASFGKLIRSIYPSLKTRRLGTRGHSKYHYNGLRVKDGSEMAQQIDVQSVTRLNFDNGRTLPASKVTFHYYVSRGQQHPRGPQQQSQQQLQQEQHYQQHLEKDHKVQDSAPLPAKDISTTDDEQTMIFVSSFGMEYRERSRKVFDAVCQQKFSEAIEMAASFWRNLDPVQIENLPSVLNYIRDIDLIVFSGMVTFSLPRTIHSASIDTIQTIFTFSQHLYAVVANLMQNFPPIVQQTKLPIMNSFITIMKDMKMLWKAGQAVSLVIRDSEALEHMKKSWSQIEFEAVLLNVANICNLDVTILRSVEEMFQKQMTPKSSVQSWTYVIEHFYQRCLPNVKGWKSDKYLYEARELQLRWSYFTGAILRELSLNDTQTSEFVAIFALLDLSLQQIIQRKYADIRTSELQSMVSAEVGVTLYPGFIWVLDTLITPVSSPASQPMTPNTKNLVVGGAENALHRSSESVHQQNFTRTTKALKDSYNEDLPSYPKQAKILPRVSDSNMIQSPNSANTASTVSIASLLQAPSSLSQPQPSPSPPLAVLPSSSNVVSIQSLVNPVATGTAIKRSRSFENET